ncbi:NAD(P)H-dependent oxidoreductase [Microbacterium bovistercoris]|uniref:NAD(P)H-dependent oxidoreductase n=1 Tax=Microbacterium bovistercoris TaxID=2293570 RepID=A0A371NTW1_9MICO|nr:NADPH-dependent FMN reductase [Microbacterium bovistercoris]REJ05732.1 NAD(P)H-dependent oxidoreductase [Microbacterium bovistercoris]
MTYRIGYLIGSLASDSINRVLSKALVKLAPDDLEMFEIPIRDLPIYNRDDEYSPGPAVTAFKQAVESADGLLFISPEYNRSIPGALKNAIDIGSRPWGQNSFARKPTGIIGASAGAIGTAVMQSSMRSVLSFLDAPQLNAPEAYIHFDPEVFAADGTVSNESTAQFLAHYMSEYSAFVARVLSSALPGHMGDSDPEVMH